MSIFLEFYVSLDAIAELMLEKGKWSVAEVLLHVLIRIRAIFFNIEHSVSAKDDKTSFPGFDQDDMVGQCHSNARSIAEYF